MFSTILKAEIIILKTFHLQSANALNLVQSKKKKGVKLKSKATFESANALKFNTPIFVL